LGVTCSRVAATPGSRTDNGEIAFALLARREWPRRGYDV
jgi:hypothetical protein